MKKYLSILFCLVSLFVLVSCSKRPDPVPQPTEVTPTPIVTPTEGGDKTPTPVDTPTPVVTPTPEEILVSNISLSGASKVEIGSQITLTAFVTPTNATNPNVSWKSSDEQIATVTDGVVTGISEGKVTITALALDGSDVKGELEITVKAKPKQDPTDLFLTLLGKEYHDGDIIEVTEGDVLDLNFRYVPSENVSEGVDMSVSNEKYAYINDGGQLVCLEPGNFALVVFALYGDVEQNYVFKVKEKHYEVETVAINAPYTEFEETFECKLTAVITPEKASQEVTWLSSDETVATVNSDGVVTGIKAGSVKIVAISTDDTSKSGSIDLVIKEAVPFDRSKIYVNSSYTNFGETVTVDGNELIVGKNALATIEEAMKVASSGAKIYLAAGTYEGSLNLEKEVQLIGPNKGIHGVFPRGDEAVFTGLVTITASGVVLDGLKLIEKAAVRVGADNVTLKNLIIEATTTKCNGNNRQASIVDYSPANNGMGDGSEYINNLTVKYCKIVVPGTTWGYLANYMSFTKINNLYVTGNYITNEGTNPGTAGEGIMVYYMNGDLVFKDNIFEYATDQYLMKVAYYSTDCEKVEIIGNTFAGRDELSTGTIGIIKNTAKTNVVMMNNKFMNVKGSGGVISFETSNANAHIDLEYNLFDEKTPFAITKTANKNLIVDNNCYLGGEGDGNLYGGPTKDATTYATQEALDEAYKNYLETHQTPIDTSVVYVDKDLDEEDGNHFYTIKKAYEAVTEGGIIRVASGTYEEEVITWNKACTVIGPNEAINGNEERRSEAIYVVLEDKVFISAPVTFIGMYIKGRAGGANDSGVYFQTQNVEGDIAFINCLVTDMNTFVKFNSGNYNLKVEGCKFSTIGQFILWIMSGNNDVEFIGNYVLSNTCGAVVNANASLLRIRSGNAKVLNNTFVGTSIAGDGLFENGVADNSFVVKYNAFIDVTTYVHNNGGNAITFDNNYYSLNGEVQTSAPEAVKAPGVVADEHVFATLDDLAEAYSESDHPAPAGTTIRVSSAYTQTNDTHFKTIKAALEAAKEGDVIYVYPGKYTDTLTINKNNISIIGYNYDLELDHTDKFSSDASLHTIISGKINISKGVTNLVLSGFVSGGQITISGVNGIKINHVISLSPTYDWALDGCIRVNDESSDIEIDHFYISGNCPNRGIHINAKVTNFSIKNSQVLDGTSTMYDFIRFSQSSNISTAFGTIVVENCYIDGIQSGFMDRVPAGTTYIIKDNYFKNVRVGITFMDVEGGKETPATITIEGNTFDGCGDIENKWSVLEVITGNETDVQIHNNSFKNSFANGESDDYYIINVFQGLGTIDCANNTIDKESQKTKVNNATGITWTE